MYSNLILGAVALVAVWLLLKKLFVREDSPAESPVALFKRELAMRETQKRAAAQNIEALQAQAVNRMRPVVAALEDLAAAMPEEARRRLSWEDGGSSLVVLMTAGPDKAEGSLTVVWREHDLVLGDTEAGRGEYHLCASATASNSVAPDLDACVRTITSFLIDFVA